MRKYTLLIVIIALFFPMMGNSQSQNLFEISKNIEIFTGLYKQLDLNYVDEINPGSMMKTGIDAMLATLDPYTNYIPESDIEDYRFMTTGQYGGIGATIQQRDNHIIITEPYQGSPADKAGLIAGDIIIEINGNSTKDKTVDDVSNILKGEPGSAIRLKISHEGIEKDVSLNRENIQVENIPYSGMLNDHIGYLKLNGFTQNASKEVRDAFMKLKETGNLKGLIFDLRGNGGGLLNEAVNIANLFVEKDQMIVSTKGRLPSANTTYKTMMGPVDKDIPLVFLVDKMSASASEILAGSMQDLDRAVILGQRSFGKGLVQNVLPISYNSQFKITVAKYYIPSGRCIQAIDYTHKDADGNAGKIADSLVTAFKTRNGRTVYDGGGIEPDIIIDPAKFSGIANNLIRKFYIFDFVSQYKKEHPVLAPAAEFSIDDQLYQSFISFLKDKPYHDYTNATEKLLEDIRKNAEKDKYFALIEKDYESLKKALSETKSQDLQNNKDEIKSLLRDEIMTRYYYQKGRVVASLTADNEIVKAKEILDDLVTYNNILSGTAPKKEKEIKN